MTEGALPDPRLLAAAGWSTADVAWEALQLRGAEAWRRNDPETASAAWTEALELARSDFDAGDARLATSLANQAVAARRAGKTKEAQRLLKEAQGIWALIDDWIEDLRPERRARSAHYHLRLERRYPGGYAHISRNRYREIAAEGAAALQALARGLPTPDGLARWRKEAPSGLDDSRKIMAAAWLIAPG